MPRKKVSKPEDRAREAEILNAPVDESNQAVKALMSPEFVQASNMDAAQIALMLQELVRGQNSLLANMQNQGLEIAKLYEKQDRIDQEIAKRDEEQRKFVEEILDRAEDLKRTGVEHDKLIAKGAAQFQEAIVKARADKVSKDLAFRENVLKGEKVMVISAGQLVTAIQQGQQVAKIIPEEVRIKNMVWVLQPGVPTMVPKVVKEVLDQRRASAMETAKRKELLGKNLESTKLAEEWGKIGGSTTETMPQ